MRSSVIRVPPTRIAPSSSIFSGTGSAWIAMDILDYPRNQSESTSSLYVGSTTDETAPPPIDFPSPQVQNNLFPPTSPSLQLSPHHETPQFSEIGRRCRQSL